MKALFYAVPEYTYESIVSAFAFFKEQLPSDEIRAALWNVTEAVRKPFLEMKQADIQKMSDADLVAGFAFAQEAIKVFKQNEYVLSISPHWVHIPPRFEIEY